MPSRRLGVSNLRSVIAEELDQFHPRLALALALIRPLPPHVGNRLRALALRCAGFDVPSTTSIWGTPTIVGRGPIASRLHLGEDCWVNIDCHFELAADVTIGDRVAIGHGVMILTNAHTVGSSDRRAGDLSASPVTIGDGAWISSRSLVLPGVTIGSGSIVAAGAVVRSDVPSNVLVAGVPAKVVRNLDSSECAASGKPPIARR